MRSIKNVRILQQISLFIQGVDNSAAMFVERVVHVALLKIIAHNTVFNCVLGVTKTKTRPRGLRFLRVLLFVTEQIILQ